MLICKEAACSGVAITPWVRHIHLLSSFINAKLSTLNIFELQFFSCCDKHRTI